MSTALEIVLSLLSGLAESVRETLPSTEDEAGVWLAGLLLGVRPALGRADRRHVRLRRGRRHERERDTATRTGAAGGHRDSESIRRPARGHVRSPRRRGLAPPSAGLVGDIEIVAVPKVERASTGLFEDMPTDVDMLARRAHDGAARQRRRRAAARRQRRPRWGPTLKYAHVLRAATIDLFTPCAERFGWILLLRTGPAAFSRQLVLPQKDEHGRLKTRDGRPGLLPPHVMPRDGWLTYRTSGERIETTEEATVFELFKLPFRTAWERV
jgi:hypothetical protein